MKVVKGQSRLVIIFPMLGIAVKFPRVYVTQGLRTLHHQVSRGRFQRAWKRGMHLPGSIRGPFFQGVVINWHEFRFYRNTRHTFLQPTYFSLFGFVNIQRAGKPCLEDPPKFWNKMHCVIGDALFIDPHHFENPDNFTVVNGKLKMHDYGWGDTQQIIKEYGRRIADEVALG